MKPLSYHSSNLSLPNFTQNHAITSTKRSRPEVFLGKGVLKICSKFTGKHPC